jgi:hypothetical protein
LLLLTEAASLSRAVNGKQTILNRRRSRALIERVAISGVETVEVQGVQGFISCSGGVYYVYRKDGTGSCGFCQPFGGVDSVVL